jgi:hypothetical protein
VTRRSLKSCRVQQTLIDLTMVDLAVLAEVPVMFGADAPYTRLCADPRSLRRDGLTVILDVGVRYTSARFSWIPVRFYDGVATCDLGLWLPALSGITITLTPHQGTMAYSLPEPTPCEAGEPTAFHPDSLEGRITAALSQADDVAKRAIRKHLARIAHPDLAPESERPARTAALTRAFSMVERGHFAIDP